jgi:hypothetical protein
MTLLYSVHGVSAARGIWGPGAVATDCYSMAWSVIVGREAAPADLRNRCSTVRSIALQILRKHSANWSLNPGSSIPERILAFVRWALRLQALSICLLRGWIVSGTELEVGSLSEARPGALTESVNLLRSQMDSLPRLRSQKNPWRDFSPAFSSRSSVFCLVVHMAPDCLGLRLFCA